MDKIQITLTNEQRTVWVDRGVTLLEVQVEAGLHPDAPCGGQGTCGKCLVEIRRSPFLVGVEAGSVDYCVTDNPAVSRRHARFFLQDGQCSVADQKSTNRTYVNDCALEPQTPQLLRDGDRIRLANEDFTFVQEG